MPAAAPAPPAVQTLSGSTGLTGPDPAAVVGPPAGPPLAEGAALEAMIREAGARLRCPVCQGLSVADSPADAAVAMRDEVKVLAAMGYDADQILDYFEASYGEFIRLDPKKEGFSLLVWLLPVGFVLLGGGLVWTQLGRSSPAPAPPAEPTLDPYLARVRAELEANRD